MTAALASALFLGFAPVLGRAAIEAGVSPFAVVALRTILAAALLFLIVLIFRRHFLYIFPLGLAGCALAGVINGVGSLLYYVALGRLSASLGQLLYSLYPLFVALWLVLDQQPPTRLTLLRLILAAVAVLLLTLGGGPARIDLLGVALMIGAAALYALHLPINQRVLYEIPAPTVTLYTLLAMSAVVVPGFLLFDGKIPHPTSTAWGAVAGLTLVTFLSRLTLFLGVKHLGGMQTALLGLGELIVTIIFGHLLLHEQLTLVQLIGALILAVSIFLVALEKPSQDKKGKGGWLSWIRPPGPPQVPWDLQHQ